MSSPLAQKIRDQRLRKLAEGGSGDETIDVIVELDVSLPKVVMEKDAHADHRVARPVAVQPLGAEAQREVDRKVQEARALFAEITGSTPRWLRPACAFVIQVDGRATPPCSSIPTNAHDPTESTAPLRSAPGSFSSSNPRNTLPGTSRDKPLCFFHPG